MGFGTSIACDISMNTRLSAEERKLYQDSEVIRDLLHRANTVAIVGLSDKKERASNFVGSYLKSEGYKIIPVNPLKTEILGEKCYPDLKSIPVPVDIVDIFRRPDEIMTIVREAIAIRAKAIWMQLGIVNRDAAELARANGLLVIMDRCMKMEHGRYSGALHWAGMNTEIVTAKKAGRLI
ncbi:MAG TPA: CoA-binding protein [Cyclobacteriaceae bacterium]|nr:CoA-binding protein [Cyclobacteriaceae bacterium]